PPRARNAVSPSTRPSLTQAASAWATFLICAIQTFCPAARSTVTCPRCSLLVGRGGHGWQEKRRKDWRWRNHSMRRGTPARIWRVSRAKLNKSAPRRWNGCWVKAVSDGQSVYGWACSALQDRDCVRRWGQCRCARIDFGGRIPSSFGFRRNPRLAYPVGYERDRC